VAEERRKAPLQAVIKDLILLAVTIISFYFAFSDRSIAQARNIVTQEQITLEITRAEKIHEELRKGIEENTKAIKELAAIVNQLVGLETARKVQR
jgi:hypothetical protein